MKTKTTISISESVDSLPFSDISEFFPSSKETCNIILDGKLYRFKVGLRRSDYVFDPENLAYKLPCSEFDDELVDYINSGYYIPIILREIINLGELPEKVASELLGIPNGYISQKKAQLITKLHSCGDWASYEYYCKSCLSVGRDGLLKKHKSSLYCESRYCVDPDCIVDRFAGNVEMMESIKTFNLNPVKVDGKIRYVVGKNSLRELWHMSFDTELVSLEDFRNDFSNFKKKFEYVMSNFWARMKKKGGSDFWKKRDGESVCLPAVRALDFSFERRDQDKLFVHYHFGVIPPKRGCKKKAMHMMNEVREEILGKQRNKFLFNWHEHKNKSTESGYTPIKGLLAYLAKRSAGMYKHGEGKNLDWNNNDHGKMKSDIISGKYFFLQDFLSTDEYLNHFYGRRCYATVGGLPRGSNRTNNIESEMPTYCPHCQKELTRHDIKVCITLNVAPPPDSCDKLCNF